MGNNGGVDDALKKHKNIGSTSEPVVNVDKSDDEPPPLVERVSAVPYDADSEPDDDHSTHDDYTTQSCPLRYSFCLCQTQTDEICATCEPPLWWKSWIRLWPCVNAVELISTLSRSTLLLNWFSETATSP